MGEVIAAIAARELSDSSLGLIQQCLINLRNSQRSVGAPKINIAKISQKEPVGYHPLVKVRVVRKQIARARQYLQVLMVPTGASHGAAVINSKVRVFQGE